MRALSSRPFCSYDGRQAGLGYLSAGWRYTTARGIIVPFPQLLADRLFFAWHPLGEHMTDRDQGTRAGQHHPEAPQAKTVAWGLLRGARGGIIVVSHWSKPAWQTMASRLVVVGCGTSHSLPKEGSGIGLISESAPCKAWGGRAFFGGRASRIVGQWGAWPAARRRRITAARRARERDCARRATGRGAEAHGVGVAGAAACSPDSAVRCWGREGVGSGGKRWRRMGRVAGARAGTHGALAFPRHRGGTGGGGAPSGVTGRLPTGAVPRPGASSDSQDWRAVAPRGAAAAHLAGAAHALAMQCHASVWALVEATRENPGLRSTPS